MFNWLFGPTLVGVRLNKWQYLGRTKLTHNYPDGTMHSQAWVYIFCDKKDHLKRRVVLEKNAPRLFLDHGWLNNYSVLWEAGEYPLYHSVGNEPSIWLKKYMLDTMNALWDDKVLDWYENEPTIEKGDGNIIKLSFPPKKDVDGEKKVE